MNIIKITFWKQQGLKTWKRVDSNSSRHVSKKEMDNELLKLVEANWKLSFDEIKTTVTKP